MIKKRIDFCFFTAAIIMLLSFNDKPASVVRKQFLIQAGDTSSFAPNKGSGWSTLSSYLNQDTRDSVEFELILVLNQVKGRIGGTSEQIIGSITNNLLLPKKNQKVNYNLLPDNTWYLIIKTDGQCSMAQSKGSGVKRSELPGNPDVIPIKVRYKNN